LGGVMDQAVANVEWESEGPWELPEGWVSVPLGKLGTWIGGGTPSKANAAFWTNGSVPWVSPKDMKVAVIGETEDRITPDAVEGSSAKYVPAASVLMVMRSGILRHSFPVAVTDRVVTLNQDLRALTPYEGVSPEYVAGYLALAAKRVLDDCSKDGTTVNSIEVSALEKLQVPLAPLAEQKRIVARIDALFAEIASGEAALEAARKGLDTFRRALLKAAVTGELTKDWREINPVTETGHDLLARIKAQRAAKGQAKGRGKRTSHPELVEGRAPPLDTSGLPELPEGWAWGTVDELLEFVTSGSRGWIDYYADAGAIFVRAQNINSGVLDLSDVAYVKLPPNAEGLRTRLKVGDVLVTITGANVTVSALVSREIPEAYVNQHLALLRPLTIDVSDYLLLWLQAEGAGKTQLTKAAYGAGKLGLNLDNIREIHVAIPPPAETAEILRRVSEALAAHADTLSLLDAEAADAARLRQSILKSAFEGRLVPQDPADEPASAMLTRLKAAQSAATPPRRGRRAKS